MVKVLKLSYLICYTVSKDTGINLLGYKGWYQIPTGVSLHIKAYTFNEVYLLAGILHYNFNLNCNVQNHKNTPVINIKAIFIPLFKIKTLVYPYFHPSMTYKLI
jgi:hypothetical protein